MDLTEAIVPNSQQVNADDLAASPRTVTITNVERGTDEQKVFVHLAEYPGRTYRPSKSMTRVMVDVWGKESSAYAGRRMTIYRNPDIMFGPNKVGGIEISHMSDIDKPKTVALTVTRGRKKNFTVQPLADAPAAQGLGPEVVAEWVERIAGCETINDLHLAWREASNAKVAAHPSILAAKDKRKSEL
jgi:hypothetical protein